MTRKAALLVNLGSPDSTSVPDVRRYLKEFLSDDRVLDAPKLVRNYILTFKVLPTRPQKTAEAYKRIWTDEGSPLLVISNRLAAGLQDRIADVRIALAMRYGNPSIADVLQELHADGIDEIFLVPLYPHYAMASYETVVVKVREELERLAPATRLEVLRPFYRDPAYIDALVENARPWLNKDYDHILFSFHGVPERHLRKGDPSKAHCLKVPDCCRADSPIHEVCYRAQCFRTVSAFAARTGLSSENYSVTFQSRFGKEPWITPFTDEEIVRLAHEGVKKLFIITPAFVTDCLETLEEIGMAGRDSFLAEGGEDLQLIPCLNEHPAWIDFLKTRIEQALNATPVTDKTGGQARTRL